MLQDIFPLCVTEVKIQESIVTTPFFFSLSGSGQGVGDVKHHEFSNLHILKLRMYYVPSKYYSVSFARQNTT